MTKTKIDLIDLLERWHKEKRVNVRKFADWEGVDKSIAIYFDPREAMWTSDELHAFKGFVSREISDNINKLWES